jgi:hypothetical protein
MREGLYGEYVRYEDYARLKAEVERLEAVIKSHKDAGLRLLSMLDDERRKNAAKEGKPHA